MKKTVTDLDGTSKEMEIILEESEIKPYFDQAYQEIRPSIEMKGFRKGRVPLSIIKKRFGPRIEGESLQEAANDTFNKIVQEEELEIVGQPHIKDMQKNDDGAKFVIAYETLPKIELGDYKNLEIDEPVHAVSDEEVDEHIEKLCLHNGEHVQAEQITDENFVAMVSIQEFDEATGVPVVGSAKEDTHIFLADPNVPPEMKNSLINLKNGDEFVYKPKSEDQFAPEKTYKIKVKEILKVVPAEFDDEFAKKYSQGKFDSAEDFKEEIGFQIQEKYDTESRQHMETQIMDKIVDMHEFAPPKTVVEQVADAMADDVLKRYKGTQYAASADKNTIKEDLIPVAERRVKWEILKNKIIQKENLEIDDFELEELAGYEAGRMNAPKEQVLQALKQNKNLTENMLAKKVMEFLMDFATTNEISFEDMHAGHDHDHDRDHGHKHDSDEPEIDTFDDFEAESDEEEASDNEETK